MILKMKLEWSVEVDEHKLLPLSEIEKNFETDEQVRDALLYGMTCSNFKCTALLSEE